MRVLLAISFASFALAGCSTRESSPTGFAREGLAFVATHRAAPFVSTVDAAGAHVANKGSSLSFHLARIGRSQLEAVAGGELSPSHDRIELRRGGIVEWFAHRDRGLEHGVDLRTRPRGDGPLVLEIAVDGHAHVNAGTVEIASADGRQSLRYGELSVKDADGTEVPAHLAAHESVVDVVIDDANAHYPLHVDPLLWGQEAKLAPSDGKAGDGYGSGGIAMSGSVAAVGAPSRAGGKGAVYVLRHGTTWAEEAILTAADATTNDQLGLTVSMDAGTILTGAWNRTAGVPGRGVAFVFAQSGTTWSEQAELAPSDTTSLQWFGHSVAVHGSIALVGAPQFNGARGAVYVFSRTGSTWTEQTKLFSPSPTFGEYFGWSLAFDGTTAVVGAHGYDSNRGATYAFAYDAGAWTSQGILLGSDSVAPEACGEKLAVSGSTIVVGCENHASHQGAAYVFSRSGSTWSETAKLSGIDPSTPEYFGGSVALSSTYLAVGAWNTAHPALPPKTTSGAVYLYVPSGTGWTLEDRLMATDAKGSELLGYDVAIEGSSVVAGAPGGYKGTINTGVAYAFVKGAFLADGVACSAGSACASGYCVEGVCCDLPCTGSCRSCLKSRNGTVDGTCKDVGDLSKCTSCATDAECLSTAYCKSTVCTAKQPNGTPCSAANECTSGHCTDGVCCNVDCAASCYACTASRSGVAGTDGTCTLVATGLVDPHGDCGGAKTSCTGSTLTTHVCTGSGTCKTVTSSCAPDVCKADGTTCNKDCTVDGDCGATGYCGSDGKCASKKSNGASCAADHECSALNCVDGVCCDQPCKGACQACAEPGSEGSCVAVRGAPRGTRTPCVTSDAKCAGACDGGNVSSCTYPGAKTSCGSGCVGADIAACDGKGTCAVPAACPRNFACEDATRCKTSCSVDADCAPKFGCSSGACVPKASPTCSADGLSSTDVAGNTKSCAPYACGPSGDCLQACATTADCAGGFTCELSSKTCVAALPADSGGDGGCSTTTRRGEPWSLMLVFGVLGMLRCARRA